MFGCHRDDKMLCKFGRTCEMKRGLKRRNILGGGVEEGYVPACAISPLRSLGASRFTHICFLWRSDDSGKSKLMLQLDP